MFCVVVSFYFTYIFIKEEVKTEAQTSTYMHYQVAHDVSLSSSIQTVTQQQKNTQDNYNNNK